MLKTLLCILPHVPLMLLSEDVPFLLEELDAGGNLEPIEKKTVIGFHTLPSGTQNWPHQKLPDIY